MTELVLVPKLETVLVHLLVHLLHSFWVRHLRTPEGAKVALGICNTHGFNPHSTLCTLLALWEALLMGTPDGGVRGCKPTFQLLVKNIRLCTKCFCFTLCDLWTDAPTYMVQRV